MSTKPKRGKRGRKRSRPEPTDTDNKYTKTPQRKRRKISHKRNNSKKVKDDKSQSVEPSGNTLKKNASTTTTLRRYSTHVNYDSDHTQDDNDTDYQDKESSSEQSPDSTAEPVPRRTHTRSQPSTPIRGNNTNYKLTPHHSQSAKRSRTTQRRYIRNSSGFTQLSPLINNTPSHNNRNIHTPSQYNEDHENQQMATPTDLFQCDCKDPDDYNEEKEISYDAETTPPPSAINDSDRRQTPNLYQSQDSIEFSLSPKSTPKRQVNTSRISENYTTVIPVNPTPLRSTNDTMIDDGNSNYNNNNIPFARPPQSGYLSYAGMNSESQLQPALDDVFGTNQYGSNEENISSNHNHAAYVQEDNVQDSQPVGNKRDIFSSKFWKSVFKRYCVLQTIVFVAIGVVIGLIVSGSVPYENQLDDLNHSTPTIPTQLYPVNTIVDTCTCDITQNKSSILCNPCMDQYWSLEKECSACEQEKSSLKVKNEEIREEMNECKAKKTKLERQLSGLQQCELNRKEIKSKHEQCVREKERLQQTAYTNTNANTNCEDKQTRIDELEHELGECNVEWGACEQAGRQKDKLDEKRVEEIEKQKDKFTLCNNQLKKYKQKAKEQRRADKEANK